MGRGVLASGALGQHNGLPATIVISTTLKELESGAGQAVTAGGSLLPMPDVIRMASYAHHYLVIFDNHTRLPLYLGRSKRIASSGQRIVLHARDRGCTFPGCTVPGYGCQAHHGKRGWSKGGQTNIDEEVLACGPHNRLVEEVGWTTRIRKDGRTEMIPPRRFNFAASPATTKTGALLRPVNLRPVSCVYAVTDCLEDRSQGQWQIAEEPLPCFGRLTVEHDAAQGETPPRVCPHKRRPVRKELSPFLWAEVLGDNWNDFVFLVVEVFVDERRESRDLGHELLGTPGVTRLGPRDCGGPNSLAGIIDGAMRFLHPGQLGGSARRPGGQPWPHKLILGRMMKMHRRHDEVDVLGNHCGAPAVTGSDTAYKASSIVQLPAEATVNQRHLEWITRHLYPPAARCPKLLSSVGPQLREGAKSDAIG